MKYVHGQGNVGFAKGCNLGASFASEDLLLFVNPDCIVNEKALVKTSEALLADNDAFAATAVLRYPDGLEQRGGRRLILTPSNIFSGINLLNQKMPEETTYVEAISGAFMLFKREKFEQIGKFDEGYFLHVEDMDLCLQIKNSGGKILLVPSVSIYHHLSTSDVSSVIVEYHKAKSLQYYFNKNFPQMGNFKRSIIFSAIWLRYAFKWFKGRILVKR
jgi:GT2 family glycosyltransferase